MVLDETDQMIDMEFEPPVNARFEKTASSNLRLLNEEEMDNDNDKSDRIYRQAFVFSASIQPAVEKYNPVKQNVLCIQEKHKMLQKLLLNNYNGQVMKPLIMIFVNIKKNADTLAKYLRSQSFISTEDDTQIILFIGVIILFIILIIFDIFCSYKTKGNNINFLSHTIIFKHTEFNAFLFPLLIFSICSFIALISYSQIQSNDNNYKFIKSILIIIISPFIESVYNSIFYNNSIDNIRIKNEKFNK